MPHAPLSATDPRSVGRYTLVGRLGAGGMGTVYLGRDGAGTPVAVKLLHDRLAGDPGFLARFAAEAAAARKVAGFCTARVIEADVRGSRPYLVTEYVEGPSLQDVLRSGGPLPASHVEALAVGVAAALTAIHAAGVIHRDLKPSNVMLSAFGPKVIDFGVAKALGSAGPTELGVLVGTPGWMAPEQLSGVVTAASDVYVWGLLIANAGTGWRPAPELRPTRPTAADLGVLPANLAAVVSAALHADPKRRPAARELLLRLCGSADVGPVRTATAVLTRPWDPTYSAVAPGSAAVKPPRRAPRPPSRAAGPGVQPAARPGMRPALPGQRAATPGQRPAAPWRPGPVPYPQPAPQRYRPVRARRRWYRRKRVLLPLTAVAVFALMSSADEPGQGKGPPPLTARDGILEFVVTGVECGQTSLGAPAVQRRAQGQLCTVDLRVHNFGSQSRRVHVGSQKLHDGSGREFRADDGAWVYLPESVPFFQQEINPGNRVEATLVYDIAADAVPARLEVHDSPLSGGAVINL